MSTSAITLRDEFAVTMQELVEEAKKSMTAPASAAAADSAKELRREMEAVETRIERLEGTMKTGFAKLAAAITAAAPPPPPPEDPAPARLLKRLDENVVAIRNTETVNQRLFNSLHEELKGYRDNFFRESLQKPYIRDLLVVIDDLSRLSSHMQSAENPRPEMAHWCNNLESSIHSVMEILHRLEVTEIEARDRVDLSVHRVVTYEQADFKEEDGQIVLRVKRGFMWRDKVLRPEEVVAKRFN